jgi:hypothetical protein
LIKSVINDSLYSWINKSYIFGNYLT